MTLSARLLVPALLIASSLVVAPQSAEANMFNIGVSCPDLRLEIRPADEFGRHPVVGEGMCSVARYNGTDDIYVDPNFSTPVELLTKVPVGQFVCGGIGAELAGFTDSPLEASFRVHEVGRPNPISLSFDLKMATTALVTNSAMHLVAHDWTQDGFIGLNAELHHPGNCGSTSVWEGPLEMGDPSIEDNPVPQPVWDLLADTL